MNIIIVLFNLPELEHKCIESVKKYTNLERHTLTVYDNYPKKENLAVVWNRLIEESKDENICLLNSDTIVEKDWTRLEENIEAGAVGPITNNCGGNQKHLEKKDSVEEINDLSGFCYCFTKKVWEEVGKFPEDMPFYGQESVFNRKLEDHGYKLMVDRRVYVHHYKGQSWHKARKDGDINDNNREYGKMQYYNFMKRLDKMQKLPRDIVIMGAGPGNPFPTFIGIDQFISDFGGKHISMEDEIPQCDVLIVVQVRHKKEWYDKIRLAKARKKILYFMDLRVPEEFTYKLKSPKGMSLDWDNRDLTIFDKVFICAKEFIDYWKKRYGVEFNWLQQATIQQPTPPVGEHYGIVHIGALDKNFHQNRIDILEKLPNVKQINEFDRKKRAEVVSKQWGIYGSSDFSLSVSPQVEGYTSDRLFHIMGSGGVALSYNPGGLNHLKDYALWFKTIDEAKELLETPKEERDKIKKRAFDYCQSNHTYKDRIIHILENL